MGKTRSSLFDRFRRPSRKSKDENAAAQPNASPSGTTSSRPTPSESPALSEALSPVSNTATAPSSPARIGQLASSKSAPKPSDTPTDASLAPTLTTEPDGINGGDMSQEIW